MKKTLFIILSLSFLAIQLPALAQELTYKSNLELALRICDKSLPCLAALRDDLVVASDRKALIERACRISKDALTCLEREISLFQKEEKISDTKKCPMVDTRGACLLNKVRNLPSLNFSKATPNSYQNYAFWMVGVACEGYIHGNLYDGFRGKAELGACLDRGYRASLEPKNIGEVLISACGEEELCYRYMLDNRYQKNIPPHFSTVLSDCNATSDYREYGINHSSCFKESIRKNVAKTQKKSAESSDTTEDQNLSSPAK